mmetsp:Transcript_36718/g.96544  ORF Transcript_36718/g.96544 Transcript_36718/m.96544 type:complete len:261 (-) Transcript_36718:183-965(-)
MPPTATHRTTAQSRGPRSRPCIPTRAARCIAHTIPSPTPRPCRCRAVPRRPPTPRPPPQRPVLPSQSPTRAPPTVQGVGQLQPDAQHGGGSGAAAPHHHGAYVLRCHTDATDLRLVPRRCPACSRSHRPTAAVRILTATPNNPPHTRSERCALICASSRCPFARAEPFSHVRMAGWWRPAPVRRPGWRGRTTGGRASAAATPRSARRDPQSPPTWRVPLAAGAEPSYGRPTCPGRRSDSRQQRARRRSAPLSRSPLGIGP